MTLPSFVRVPFAAAAMARYAMAAAAIVLTAWTQWGSLPSAVQVADEWVRDRYTLMQLSEVPEQRMLVVDIDETTLVDNPWPWPRTRLAELVEMLLVDGAESVALDIMLQEPADAAGDARLAQLAAHGPVVLGQMFDYNVRFDPLRVGKPLGGIEGRNTVAVPATGYLTNHAGLARAAHVGNIGFIPDADGVLRHVPMWTAYGGRNYPTLTLAQLHCCDGKVMTPDRGLMRVPFRRHWNAYTVVNAWEVFNGKVPQNLIKGKKILIGSSSLSLGDRVSSPLGPNTAGLLVHAALLSSLLDEHSGLAPTPWPGRWMALAASALVAVLAIYSFARLPAIASVAVLATVSVLWLFAAYQISEHDLDFAPSGPLLSILFLLAVAVPFHWQLTQQKSRRLLGTLRQYVATSVVDELLRLGLKDPLAPREAYVTTLIADMEGYTTQVESLPVEEAAKLTTDFLDCLTRPVLEQHGTLDKYTGDGLVAFWGAPLPIDDHADLALDAAREILREVDAYSRARVRNGMPPLRVRIGIESGVAMAGDYGTAFRSIYTAVGDCVNTASRLEQLAREFPHDVIIGEGTVRCSNRHRFKMLGQRHLRGKENLITLFTLEDGA
jgi:adenylate cyclase